MKCSACDQDCEATFVCIVCRERKNVCRDQVGGFNGRHICDNCHLYEQTGLTARDLRVLSRKAQLKGES